MKNNFIKALYKQLLPFLVMAENNDTLPDLFAVDKAGKNRIWRTWVEDNVVYKEYGLVDGKLILGKREYDGVNKGKANELSPKEHAIDAMKREWTKQLDKGYAPSKQDKNGQKIYNKVVKKKDESGGMNTVATDVLGTKNKKIMTKTDNFKIDGLDISYAPMLADPYTDEPKVHKYYDWKKGAYIDPKLDGIRCIAYLWEGQVVLATRNKKQFPFFSNIREDLKTVFDKHPDLVLDGELFVRKFRRLDDNRKFHTPEETFSLIQGACSVGRLEPSEYEDQIQYWIFDIIDTEAIQDEREMKLVQLEKHCFSKAPNRTLVKVERTIINDPSKIPDLCASFMEKGFEGVIIRDRRAKYEIGHRSKYLRKFKEFEDAEFTIIGFKEGQGTEKGCVVWICKTKNGEEFDVRPQGSFEERKEYMKHADEYIGLPLTVKYQGLSADGIPRFPVGIAIRDYE